jgi:hypothetical protein
MDLTVTVLVIITARLKDMPNRAAAFIGRSITNARSELLIGDNRLESEREMEPKLMSRVPVQLRHDVRGEEMVTYRFNVFNRDQTIAANQSVAFWNLQAVWPKVTELAWSIGESGGQIKVTDQSGRVVVLVGVNSARRAGFESHRAA